LTKCSLHLTANMWSQKLPIAEYSVVKKPLRGPLTRNPTNLVET